MLLSLNTVLADSLLASYKDELGADFTPYRNHVMRCLQFCHLLSHPGQEAWDKLQIAAVFHDLGIWTADTFDYIEPSVALAEAWLHKNGHADWSKEVATMIRDHHKVSSSQSVLAEVFRKADWIDVSFGLLSYSVPRKAIRRAYNLFPDQGFHLLLAGLFTRHMLKDPFHPLPMFKW
jgi:predicted metal-dependent HD superfamily phosphohydrolase